MYTLQINTVDDFPHPFAATSSATGSLPASKLSSKKNNFTHITELKGVVHLFRCVPPTTASLTSPVFHSTTLFVAAVPNYIFPNDFLLFCGSYLDHFSKVCFLRNDAMKDRYSVLITSANQLVSDGFYFSFNGKRFRPSEDEVCHLYFTQSVVCHKREKEASSPPPGFTELPTCPVCLERLDRDTSGIQSTLCDHSFQCPCILKWTYLSCQVCRLCQHHEEKPRCADCGTQENLWVCVVCGHVGCGRYQERHAIKHWKDTNHCYCFGLEPQEIWDYVGRIYVHRLNQSKADGKLTMVVEEYNRLLATQMETQRQIMTEATYKIITDLCKRQGVKVLEEDYINGDPSPINFASSRKSISLSKNSKPAHASSTSATPSSGPSTTTRVRSTMPTVEDNPDFNKRAEFWLKKIFCQNAFLIKEAKIRQKERKEDRKEMARLKVEVAWQTGYIESTLGTLYVSPETTDEEEETNEESESFQVWKGGDR